MKSFLASFEKAVVKLRRKRVSRYLFEAYGGVVQNGAFRGLILDGNANTSSGNLGAKIFGMYESEVIEKIGELGPFQDMINFGAADGYFALGALKSGLAQRSICFEMSSKGRASVLKNAQVNGLQDKVVICGAVDSSTPARLESLQVDYKRALLLCDIEGAEFSVFTGEFLNQLNGTTIIIELHDRLMSGGLQLREELFGRLPRHARYQLLVARPKDWRGIEPIEALEDNDRAPACSDGRKVLGEWLVVRAKSQAADFS